MVNYDCTDLHAIDCAGRAANRAASILHREMQRGAASLKAIACIAPLLGTFCTAMGLRDALAYYQMSAFDRGETAGGPSEVFVVFALSLPVAIVASVGFHYLNHRLETFDFEIRVATLDLLNGLARLRRDGAI
jgi:biopolymer transport protein ExbB/TolQ